jgi:hypothetical protein
MIPIECWVSDPINVGYQTQPEVKEVQTKYLLNLKELNAKKKI